MWYSIVAEDVENSLEKRLAFRDEHRNRIQSLRDSGKLLTAGPNPVIDSEEPGKAGFSGSLIIAEFPTLEAAQEWANNDPYMKNGIYTSVSVKPFKKIF